MPVLDEVEVVVVGGGIIGCATAYHLARAGRAVALVEKGVIGGEASGRNGGGVRQQDRDPAELPLAMESVRMWGTLAEELGCDLEYRRGGNLVCALTEKRAEDLKASVERQRAAGLDVHYLDPIGVREVAPAVAGFLLGASYCPTDGQANPVASTLAFGRAAARAGARVYTHNPVVGIRLVGGAISSVLTPRGEIRGRVVVNAAGPWGREIGMMVGVHLPIQPRRSQMLVTDPMPPLLSQFVSGNTVWLRQARSGNVHIGGGGAWELTDFGQGNSASTMRRYAGRAGELIPRLREASAFRCWSGTLERTPDGIPIIGWAREVPGFFIAAGFAGHGFALGPGSGKAICETIVSGKASLSLEAFSPSRFPSGAEFPHLAQRPPEPGARGGGAAGGVSR